MRIKYSYFHNLIFGMIFLLLCGVSRFEIAGILSSITMIIYVYCSITIWKEKIFLKYMHVTFTMAFLIAGLLVCEYGNFWLGEIGKTTHYNGSLSVILFYFWLLINVIILSDKHWERASKKGRIKFDISDRIGDNFVVRNAPIFIFLFNMILFLSVVRLPFFLVGAVNRFEYSASYMSKTLNVLKLLPCLFNAILLIPIVQDSRDGKINFKNLFKKLFLPNLPYFLFMIWTGNKFGSYWELLCIVLIPLFSIINLKMINIKKMKRMIFVVFVVFAGLLYLFYFLNGMNLAASSMEILKRIGCQGELWWSTCNSVSKNGTQIQEFGKELSYIADSVATEGASRTYGVYHLMDLFGVKSVVERYHQMGIRYSACGIELPYLSFGVLSLFIMAFIYGNLYSLSLNVYINAVKEKRILGCIAAGRLFQVAQGAILQGDWYAYTTLTSIFCLLVIIFTYFTPSKKLKSRKIIEIRTNKIEGSYDKKQK